MGLNVVTIKTLLICIATIHFDWMRLNCCILQIVACDKLIFSSIVDGHKTMSNIMCHDCFVG